jgi:hypothetical protein
MGRIWTLGIVALALLWPAVAEACPVCFQGAADNREAFFGTFLFLTAMPLLAAGGLIWWLVRRARQLEDAPVVPQIDAQ